MRYYKKQQIKWNKFWNSRALKYSDISNTKQAKEALLLAEGHVVEKGLTMPNRRLGFGYQKVRSLILHCKEWIKEFDYKNDALQFAIQDLVEYYNLHQNNNFLLPVDITDGIENLMPYLLVEDSVTFEISSAEYFKTVANFEELAYQRHSIRKYGTAEIDIDIVKEAVKLAQTAPSACNRQGVRVTIIDDKFVLDKVVAIQNGNRGFGHLADKLILLSFEQGAIEYEYRASGYIDVGIFAMNLLYALHLNKICACTLNSHLTIEQMNELQDILGYEPSEIPVLFIMIGSAPSDNLIIAKSKRVDVNNICRVI